MKKIFTLLITFSFIGALVAQTIMPENVYDLSNALTAEQSSHLLQKKKEMAQISTNSNKVLAENSFFIDYEWYDINAYPESGSFIWRIHGDYNANDLVLLYDDLDPTLVVDTQVYKFKRAAVSYKWLNQTYYGFDANGYAITPTDSLTTEWTEAEVTIDSVFFSCLHVKNSLIPNEIRARVFPLGTDGRADYSDPPLFTWSVMTDSSYTGENGDVVGFPVNLSLPAGTDGVAVDVDMIGGDKLTDEFYLIGTMPTNCTIDDAASISKFYPNSFFNLQASSEFPLSNVNGYNPSGNGSSIYLDFNGNSMQDDCEAFFIQDWSIWMKVTADIPIALNANSSANNVCSGTQVTLSSSISGAVDPVSYSWTSDGPYLFSPTAPVTDVVVDESSTFTLVITDGAGTTDTAIIVVEVDDLNVNVVGDLEVDCGTTSVQLVAQGTSSVNNDFSYNWANINESNAVVNVNPGTYTVTIFNGNGCSDTETANVTFTDSNLQSDFTYVNSQSSIVDFTNASTDATTFIWDFGDGNVSGAENPTYQYASGGQYNVRLTTLSGSCLHEVYKTVAVNPNTGTSIEDEIDANISLYPNPANEIYNVQVQSAGAELIEVSIYNVNGELMHGISESSIIDERVNLEAFSSGIYFVNIKINDIQTTQKLVVNK